MSGIRESGMTADVAKAPLLTRFRQSDTLGGCKLVLAITDKRRVRATAGNR